MPEALADGGVTLWAGDSREVLKGFADASVDSVVTDPPYGLGFMGKEWDTHETAFDAEFWRLVWLAIKPGGHVAAFGGTRSYHRLAVAIEDAGFEIRDQLAWVYGSGFPKSHDVSKGIDRAAGERQASDYVPNHRNDVYGNGMGGGVTTMRGEAITPEAGRWQGWGTALKPAWEPIVLARKPLVGTVAANVLAHGTGALNIDGCRVGDEVRSAAFTSLAPCTGNRLGMAGTQEARRGTQGEPREYVGRWPANLVHDGSAEVVECFPETASGELLAHHKKSGAGLSGTNTFAIRDRTGEAAAVYGDSGSAARFFYTAKADADDRLGSKHPTVKPLDLMQWLVRLVTPPGGTVLDPFAGTGTTGEAAWREGFSAILIEREEAYQNDIRRRMNHILSGPDERMVTRVKARGGAVDPGPLFAWAKA